MHRGWNWVTRLAAAVLLLALTLWIAGPAALLSAMASANPWILAAALGVSVASNVVSALRWSAIARALGLSAPTGPVLAMYARGMTSNTVLPGATLSGDMLRSVQLARLGNPLVACGLSVAFDRFSGLWTLCVLSFAAALAALAAGVGTLAIDSARGVLIGYGSLMGIIVALPFVPWPLGRLAAVRIGAIRRAAELLQRVQDPASGLKPRLLRTLGLSFVVQALSGIALALCGRALGLDTPLLLMLAAAAPIFVMGAVPLGVAGFGTRELAAVGVLGLAGVGPDFAAATGFLYGVLGVVQGVLAAPLFVLGR